MHLPDGFIDVGTSAGFAAVSVVGMGVCLKKAGQELDERQVPLAGLVAAFVFAVQMINFPVAGGTSGHLLGGVLAVVLVGPWLGATCVAVVLAVQALLFADGGLSALGLTVFNLSVVAGLGGYLLYLGLRAVLPSTRTGLVAAAGVAAGLSVVLSSISFSVQYALGGTGGASVATVLGAMVGVHVLIGIGEGIITALTVSAVVATRPDLIHGEGVPVDPPGAAAVAGAR